MEPSSASRSAGSPLARFLLVAYAMLITYASLYPLQGWRMRGAGAWSFLGAPLPEFITTFDLVTNVLIYVPLGFLAALAAYPRLGRIGAVVVASLAGALLSGCLEALQTFLPSRIASNLDLGLNAIGGLLGSLVGAWSAPYLLGRAALRRWRAALFRAGARADLGLVVVALWLLTQLNPETLLFGNGTLRSLWDTVPANLHPAVVFVRVEAIVTAAHLLALALFIGTLVQPGRPIWLVVLVVTGTALLIRSVAFATLFTPERMLQWATPGALLGLAGGLGAALVAARLSRRMRVAIASVLLLVATALVNFAPGNPYTANALQVWQQGHFFNFNGLTSFVSTVWPALALAYLIGVAVPSGTRAHRSRETSG